MLRLGIDVEIADGGHGPRWSEDLIRQVLGVERFGVVDVGVGIRRAFLRAEDAVKPRHSESPRTDDHQYEQRNPQPPQKPQNPQIPSARSMSCALSAARTCNYTSAATNQTAAPRMRWTSPASRAAVTPNVRRLGERNPILKSKPCA